MPAISAPRPLHSLSSKRPNKTLNLISIQLKSHIQCELKNTYPAPQKWTLDCVSTTDPIHIILKPPNSKPMASSLDSSLRESKRIYLFYCSEMKDLAERISFESDAVELRTINWRTFEDGFPNLFIPNAQGVRGQHVAFLASFSSPGVIFEQLSVIYALTKLFVASFTLVLPFFPTGTSERMEDEGDVATAFTLARILSNIPIGRGGPTSLVIFDIHALQERFYFGDNVLPCFESGIPLLLNRLQQLPDSDNITLAFPDDGACKRFHKQLQHFPMRCKGPSRVCHCQTRLQNPKLDLYLPSSSLTHFETRIVCAKVREGDQRIVRIKEGDPKGRHVVIVDDLVQSGGTLAECQKVLAKHGAVKISAYVTHGIFPNKSWERFNHDEGVQITMVVDILGNPETGMTYFWITDSCPETVKKVKHRRPFEVLSLAAAIASALQI
ncbi:ribose phosphate diphosphokinase subunit prs3 [Orobanche hederae]